MSDSFISRIMDQFGLGHGGDVTVAPAPKIDPLDQSIPPKGVDRWKTTLGFRLEPAAVARLLKTALNGECIYQHDLFELMEDSWDRLRKNLQQLKTGASQAKLLVHPFCVEGQKPTASAEAKADVVRKALTGWTPRPDLAESDLDDTIYCLVDAAFRGVVVQEILWEVRDGLMLPRATQCVSPLYWSFPANEYGLKLRINGLGTQWTEVPENKFLIGTYRSKFGHPISQGLLRPLAWWWSARLFGRDWLLNYAQIFGVPFRSAEYDLNASQQVKADIANMLENMGSAGWAAFPAGTKFEIKETSKSGDQNPQAHLIDLADKVCDIILLGQTLTTDVASSGSRALGDVHASVLQEKIQGLTNWAAQALTTQMVPMILKLNFGDASEAPKIVPDFARAEAPFEMANRDAVLMKAGLPMPKAWLYERHSIPMPDASTEVINTPAPSPLPSPQPLNVNAKDASLIRASMKQNLANRLSDNVMANLSPVAVEWLAPVRPIFAELARKGLDKTVSDEDFLKAIAEVSAKMPEVFDQLDTKSLANALEAAMGSAMVNGAVERSLA